MMVSFVLSFFPRDVLDEILNLIESVSEDFPSYSNNENETLDHFLLGCEKLHCVRNHIISDLLRKCETVCQTSGIRTIDSSLLEIIVDCT